jgi:hypothetical protein
VCLARKVHGKDRNQIKKNLRGEIYRQIQNFIYLRGICEAIFAAMGKLKIEHFAMRDYKAHGKMLSVRPRRQIGRVCGTKPPVCRGSLLAVCFFADFAVCFGLP